MDYSKMKRTQFLKELEAAFGDDPKVVLSEIASKEDIMDSIKDFLGKGH